MNFGQAIEALEEGKRVARTGWDGKNMFVFQQIPSIIHKDVVPKMQSLPQDVKDYFQRTFDNPDEQITTITYSNQIAIVSASNLINGWNPSVSDTLANDWVIL
jgi:hypothetical protein